MLESEFSNLAVTSDEKQQTGWFDLPYEMRVMIIEMMDTKTRGKLSSCSKLCCKEVRRSKNFINTIKLTWMPMAVCLEVGIQEQYFSMNFSKIEEKCSISYQSYSHVGASQWDETVDRSIDDVAMEQFRRFVKDAINLELIFIDSDDFPFEEISIRHLTKLEKIIIEKTDEVDLLECGFLSINQLVNASKTVEIDDTNVEVNQLINFKASKINLRKVTLQLAQLKHYLKSWNNNEIDENVGKIKLDCSNGDNFYIYADDIVNDLDVIHTQFFSDEKWFKIKNSAGKVVDLRLTENSFLLVFEASQFDVFDTQSYTSEQSFDSEQFMDEYLDLYDHYSIDQPYDGFDDYYDYIDPLYNEDDDYY